jgi:hypothetical protein
MSDGVGPAPVWPSRLPEIGGAVENLRVDCKARYDDGEQRPFEMAKDVAAFANANGGTILIGSVERGGILQAHPGLDIRTAASTRRAIEEAVSRYVRPPPVVDFPEPVAVGEDKVVLMVEVQPFPGQAVGVHRGRKEEDPWAFPVRVGTQTVWYSPEQLVLLMDVQHRRKIQLLHAAAACGPARFNGVFHRGFQSSNDREVHEVQIMAIDGPGNAMCVSAHDLQTWVPFDAVLAVWREGDRWTIRASGQLVHYATGIGAPRLSFHFTESFT